MILSVFILVVLEFKRLYKEISYDKLTSLSQGAPPLVIVFLLLVDLVAVLSMLRYK